jgi:hypothetical protein
MVSTSSLVPVFNCGIVTLSSSKVEPHKRLHVVLRHTSARYVRDAEVVLRRGITLLGSFTKPLRSFGIHIITLLLRLSPVVGALNSRALGGRDLIRQEVMLIVSGVPSR